MPAAKAPAEDISPVREEFRAETFSSAPDSLVAPKRRGRPPGSKNKTTTSRASANIETQIGALLVTINMPLSLIPALQKDALDPVEIQALAKGIKAQCDASPTFKKYVEQALKVTGATSLLAVVAIIASRRAVRHGVVPIPEEMGGPAMVDALLGAALSTMSGQGAINPNLVVMNSAEPAA
jgi:hypothetical protein